MGAHANGVDAYGIVLSNLGGSERGNNAGVVGAIGDENDAL